MFLVPGAAYSGEFTTQSSTGEATDATGTPVATATKNGVDDSGFALTVTKLDTGRYKIIGTVPSTYVAGDIVWITVAATVATVAGKAPVDSFVVSGGGLTAQEVANAVNNLAPAGSAAAGAIKTTLAAAAAQLTAIKAKLDHGRIVVQDLVNSGNITIFSGADHIAPRIIELTFTDGNPALATAAVELRLIKAEDFESGLRSGRAIAGSLTQVGDQVTVEFAPTRVQSAGLEPGNFGYVYQVVPILTDGKVLVPLGIGRATAIPVIEGS